jgi:hypothetical protein
MSVHAHLKLPKEHGAWAMFSVPMITGILVARSPSWPVVFLALSTTFLFIARESLVVWWRSRQRGRSHREAQLRLAIYLGLAALFGAPLVFVARLFGLIPFGAAALVLLLINMKQAEQLEERTIIGEMLAIIGMTMTAPAVHYAARGEWQMTALWLWALSALYFMSSVFYVKLRVLTAHARSDDHRRQIRRRCALYHGFLLSALVALTLTGNVNLFAVIAFAPALGRAFWHVLTPASHLNLRRVGVLEIVYSLVFLAFIALSFSRA